MVVGVLKGGIGNQLFIYAAAYDFAYKNGLPLYFDCNTGFQKDVYKRNCEITHLITSIKCLPPWKCYVIKIMSKSNLIQNFLNFIKIYKKIYKVSNNTNLNQLQVRSDTIYYFQDYYQSEKYFLSTANHLSQLLRKFDLPDKYDNLIKYIDNAKSLIIHGRLKRAFDAHGTLVETKSNAKQVPNDYFIHAVDWFKKRHIVERIILFSDAPDELISLFAHLNLDVVVVNDVSNGNGIEEFILLTYGKNYIISNSTFSWWGAYLSSNDDIKVLVPPKKLWDTEIPNNWIVLD